MYMRPLPVPVQEQAFNTQQLNNQPGYANKPSESLFKEIKCKQIYKRLRDTDGKFINLKSFKCNHRLGKPARF